MVDKYHMCILVTLYVTLYSLSVLFMNFSSKEQMS